MSPVPRKDENSSPAGCVGYAILAVILIPTEPVRLTHVPRMIMI